MKSHSTSQKWNIQTILPGLRYEKAGLGRGARTKGMSRRRSWKDYWIISNYIILYDKIIILYKYMNLEIWCFDWWDGYAGGLPLLTHHQVVLSTKYHDLIWRCDNFSYFGGKGILNGFFVSQLKYQAQVIKFLFPVSTNIGKKEVVLKSEW